MGIVNLVSYPNVLKDRTRRGFDASKPDLLDAARTEAQRHSRTGEHAASLRIGGTGQDGQRIRARLGSPLPQARAVEVGANVGPRKGPHMAGLFILQTAVRRYPSIISQKLRAR